MLEDPITLISGIVVIASLVAMGGIAKDHIKAKGLHALWLVSSGLGVFHYVNITREKNKRIGFLFWVFIASLMLFLYRKS